MKREKVILLLLAAIQFTNIMDFMIMMPLGPQLMKLFSISPQQFSFIVASYTISAGICGFIGAFFIDRLDRKQALLTIYLGFTLGTFACAMAPSYHFLLLARILTGAFGGLLSSLVLSIVGDIIPFERRASAMGVVMTAFSVATVFGVPFGLFIATLSSWHAPFYLLGCIGLLLLGCIYYIIPPITGHMVARDQRPSPVRVLTNITGDSNQLRALFLMFLLMIGQFSVIPFISPYMVFNLGFTEQQLPYIYLAGGACSIFTLPLVGKLADRYGKYRLFTIFALLSIIPFFWLTNMTKSPMIVVLFVTSLFFVCMGGRGIPATTLVTSTVRPQNRGSFMSINSSVQHLASGIASFISGIIIIKSSSGELQHYPYVGYLAIITTISCVLVAGRLRPVDTAPASVSK